MIGRPHYLYVAPTISGQHFKIGVTSDLKARLRGMGSKVKFNFKDTVAFENEQRKVRNVERRLHNIFSAYRVRLQEYGGGETEWFDITCHPATIQVLEEFKTDLDLGRPVDVEAACSVRVLKKYVDYAPVGFRLALIIGENIRREREKRGLSQTDLGRRIGLHFSQISKFERGYSAPTLHALEKIAEGLEINPGLILHLPEKFGETT